MALRNFPGELFGIVRFKLVGKSAANLVPRADLEAIAGFHYAVKGHHWQRLPWFEDF